MPDRRLEDVLRALDGPVAPPDPFTRSLLGRLERELVGAGLSPAELEGQAGEELPMREAMSMITPDPIGPVGPTLDLGAVEPDPDPDRTP